MSFSLVLLWSGASLVEEVSAEHQQDHAQSRRQNGGGTSQVEVVAVGASAASLAFLENENTYVVVSRC